jgi:hypothetical protein
MGSNLRKGHRGLIKIPSQKFYGEIEENHENLSYSGQYSGRDWNRAPPEYKTRALPPSQIPQYVPFM